MSVHQWVSSNTRHLPFLSYVCTSLLRPASQSCMNMFFPSFVSFFFYLVTWLGPITSMFCREHLPLVQELRSIIFIIWWFGIFFFNLKSTKRLLFVYFVWVTLMSLTYWTVTEISLILCWWMSMFFIWFYQSFFDTLMILLCMLDGLIMNDCLLFLFAHFLSIYFTFLQKTKKLYYLLNDLWTYYVWSLR